MRSMPAPQVEEHDGGHLVGRLSGVDVVTDEERTRRPDARRAVAEQVPVDLLCAHPKWVDLIGKHTRAQDVANEAELVESIRAASIMQPLHATGENCSRPPNEVLDGVRRLESSRLARAQTVPVIYHHNLSAKDEEAFIIWAALATSHTRRLLPSHQAQLEERLFELFAVGQGFRSDLATSVGGNGGRPAGDTRDLVARASGHSPNSVANRRKVFGSRVVPEFITKLVDNGDLELTRAADLVRAVEQEPTIKGALDSGRPLTQEILKRARFEFSSKMARWSIAHGTKKDRPVISLPVPSAGKAVEVEIWGVIASAELGADGTTIQLRYVRPRPKEPRVRRGVQFVGTSANTKLSPVEQIPKPEAP